MAAPKRLPGKSLPDWRPAEFINIDLDAAQKRELKGKAWDSSSEDQALENLFDAGYKLTVSADERNGCFAAWIIPKKGNPNFGYILAGRGSTPTKAIKQACWIHFAVLEGIWGTDQGRSRDPIDD